MYRAFLFALSIFYRQVEIFKWLATIARISFKIMKYLLLLKMVNSIDSGRT